MIAPPAWANWAPNPAMLLLSAQIKSDSHNIKMFDLNIDAYNAFNNEHKLWWEDLNSLKWETIEDVEKLFDIYKPFFINYAQKIKDSNFDLIAFSVNSGARYTSRIFARLLKTELHDTPIIFGGSDCFRSELFREYMVKGVVDAVCTGEGELAFPQFVEQMNETGNIPDKITGFLTWNGDKIIDGGPPTPPKDLDNLEPVSVKNIDFNKYTKHNRLTLMISKGCINRCAYCNEGPNFGKFRSHSAKWMIKQIELVLPYLAASKQKPHINFNDSLINGKVDVLEQMCDLIIDKHIDFTWGGMAFIRKEMTFEYIKKLKNAGCIEICWGLESGSENVLKLMRKRYTPHLADKVLNDTGRAGISQYGNIIVGFPGEGPEEFAESLLFLIKNKNLFTNLGLPILTPRQNSPLYKAPHKWGLKNLLENDWVTVDETNTPEIRILRRELLSMVLDDKLFDQGRHEELKNSVNINFDNPLIANEFENIFASSPESVGKIWLG